MTQLQQCRIPPYVHAIAVLLCGLLDMHARAGRCQPAEREAQRDLRRRAARRHHSPVDKRARYDAPKPRQEPRAAKGLARHRQLCAEHGMGPRQLTVDGHRRQADALLLRRRQARCVWRGRLRRESDLQRVAMLHLPRQPAVCGRHPRHDGGRRQSHRPVCRGKG